jgi:uncharacterized protein
VEIHEIRFGAQPAIEGYGAGGFRVGGLIRQGGLMILPDRIDGWAPLAPPTPACFAAALAAADRIDLLIWGAGPDIAPLPAEVRAAFEAAGLGVETMATPAACRTYNVLLAESRRVAAALLPV